MTFTEMQMAAPRDIKKIPHRCGRFLSMLMIGNFLWACAHQPNSIRDGSTGDPVKDDVQSPRSGTHDVGHDKTQPGISSPQRALLKEEKDPETHRYFLEVLRGFGESAQLQLVQAEGSTRHPRFRAFSLDAATIFVSRSAYEPLRYESEVVGLLAWEVARRKAGVYQTGMTAMEREVQFGRDAVNLMYRSGFDPRGLVAFLEHYQNKRTLSQGEIHPEQMELLLAGVRSELAGLPPLSNPINRSQRFLELRQKWESKRNKKNQG